MTLAEIEARAQWKLTTGYHFSPDRMWYEHDHETLIRWVRALLTCAHHAATCEWNAVVATGDGSEGRGPCTCGLAALREEIGA